MVYASGMSRAVARIEQVLTTSLLESALVKVPQSGASEDEILLTERHLPRPLSAQHRALLARWNGLDLEVLRVLACGKPFGGVGTVAQSLRLAPTQTIPFADDPAGFLYVEEASGAVVSVDLKGKARRPVASSIDDFFTRFVFGKDGSDFLGADWLEELEEAGILDE